MFRQKVWKKSGRRSMNIIRISLPWKLDQARYSALTKQARDPTVSDVLEVKNFNQLLIQWLLSYLQRKIGVDVGVEPGAEMKAAILEAEQRGLQVALVDRDIRLTLLRFWQSLGIFGKIKMFYALIISIAEVDSVGEIDIEELKKPGHDRPGHGRVSEIFTERCQSPDRRT